MTTFTTTLSQLESLYVGYFGRAGDPAGINYWSTQLSNGSATLSGIAASFAVQTEATTKYPYLAAPQVTDPATFVNQVYQQLFGHAADAAGLTYWTGQLNAAKGAPAAVGAMILNIISGATGADDTVIKNRVDVSTDFTQKAANAGTNWNGNVQSQSAAEISSVDATAASVTAAKAQTDAFIAAAPGPTQNFTLGLDNLTATSQNAAFFAPLITSSTGALVQSLQVGDSAVDTAAPTGTGLTNGGQFTAFLNAAVVPVVTLKGIPTHTVTTTAAGGYNGDITGLVTLNNSSSTGTLTIGASGNGIDKGGVAGTTTVAATLLSTVNLNSVAGASAAAATTVFVNATALAGAADVLNLNFNGSFGTAPTTLAASNTVSVKTDTSAAGVSSNGYETININAAGTTNLALGDATSGIASTATINVKGAGGVQLWGDAGGVVTGHFVNLKTIDASTTTGGVLVTGAASAGGLLNGAATLTSFKGGTGVDSLDISALTAAQVSGFTSTNLDGGTGRDTLILGAIGAATTSAVNNTGFETLGLSGAGGTVDFSKFGAGIDTISLSTTAQTAALTINNLAASGLTFAAGSNGTAGNAVTLVTASTGVADSIAITQGSTTVATAALGPLTLTAFETITHTATGSSASTIASINATPSATGFVAYNLVDSATGAVSVTGVTNIANNGILTLSGTGTAGVTLTGAVTAATVNATALNTGAGAGDAGLVMSAVSATGAAMAVTGSNGADTLQGAGLNDTVSGGSGNDNMRGNGGADSLTGGSNNDTFFLASLAETQGVGFAAANTTFANIDAITDFVGNGTSAGDQIALGLGAAAFGPTFTATSTAVVSAVTIATAANYTTLTANVEAALAGTASTNAVAQVYDVTILAGAMAGRVMIINDTTAAIAATDTIVNIAGITGALNAQDFIFAS